MAWQQHRAHNWQNEQRDWQQRGGYNGYQIPEDSYRGYFGPDHGFRMSSYPVTVVRGYPRFQYGGYPFSVVDPWPEYWLNPVIGPYRPNYLLVRGLVAAIRTFKFLAVCREIRLCWKEITFQSVFNGESS